VPVGDAVSCVVAGIKRERAHLAEGVFGREIALEDLFGGQPDLGRHGLGREVVFVHLVATEFVRDPEPIEDPYRVFWGSTIARTILLSAAHRLRQLRVSQRDARHRRSGPLSCIPMEQGKVSDVTTVLAELREQVRALDERVAELGRHL
jgi:hypothetical protein